MKRTHIDLMKILKDRSKTIGLTREKLAIRLKVSVPTLKRWLAGKSVTLKQFDAVCAALGTSMAEVIAMAEADLAKATQYTLEQEKYLAAHPESLAYFDLLIRGNSVHAIERRFNLTGPKSAKILAGLEKIHLIKWLPRNRVQVLMSGEPAWRKAGPLAVRFRSEIVNEFISGSGGKDLRFLLHDYLPEDLLALQAKAHDLLDYATRASRRARLDPERATAHAICLGIASYRWPVENYLRS